MLKPTLAAAKKLEADGISAEVIDPRTLVPLDEDGILRSVRKTGRAVVVDEARDRCSAASHIAAVIADKAFSSLKAPVKRVTVPDVAMPYAPNAERVVFPSEERIASTATALACAAAESSDEGQSQARARRHEHGRGHHREMAQAAGRGVQERRCALRNRDGQGDAGSHRATSDGTLLQILVPAGEIAEVGAAVCSVDARL